MKSNINLSKKAAKYSLLASAAITMLASCGKEEPETNDPNIMETDVNPDITLTPAVNGIAVDSIDINNDGVSDFAVVGYNYNYGYGEAFRIGYVGGMNGAQVLTEEQTINVGGYIDTLTAVSALGAGNTIGPGQSTWYYYGYTGIDGTYYGSPVSFGQFLGQDKFVGVRFQASGNTHYAWVRLSMNADGTTTTVKEYAYHINPNTAIEAGAK